MSRRGDRSQQTVDAHANGEFVAKGLDMNIARTQFDRFLDEIIDRTHDGRAAGQVAQIVHALVGSDRAPALATTAGRLVGLQLVAQNHRYVVERGRHDLKGRSKNDLSRSQRLGVSGIAGGQRDRSIAGLEGEYRSVAQEPRREAIRQ